MGCQQRVSVQALAFPHPITQPCRVPARGSSAVYLIDISFFIFRAYHALPPLSASDGTPTNAVHGVATMLERLIREEEPAYLAAAFDTPGKTFRNDLFPEYKANREEPDEELSLQFPLVRRLVNALSICSVEDGGFEADDLLATLAKRFSDQGMEVVIVTGDKDLMQCVSDNVSLFDPVKNKRVKSAQVVEKFGVGPEHVAEVLGLMGDSSDNIPGVKGVGPKTASALISHFGSLEDVIERSEEIEEMGIRGAKSVRAKIEAGVESARLCTDLATVRDDVDMQLELDDLALKPPNLDALEALAQELELSRLVDRIVGQRGGRKDATTAAEPDQAAKREGKPAAKKPDETGAAEVREREPRARGDWKNLGSGEVFAILEYPAPGPPLLCLGDGRQEAAVEGADEIRAALEGLSNQGASLTGYDLKALCRDYDAEVGGEGLDLGVASYLIDSSLGDHGVDDVTSRFLGEDGVAASSPEEESKALDQVARLAAIARTELAARAQTELYETVEHPLIGVLGRIEARGILLDTERLAAISTDLDGRMAKVVKKVFAAAGHEFNILSPVQLRQVLYEELGLSTKGIKKTKTGPSTDSDSLRSLGDQHPLPNLVLEYRGMAKLKSTYVDALPRLVDENSRIHTRLNQTVTATGRLSSSDPNLQNIPIRTEDGSLIRTAFVAGRGRRLVSADYNQIELRVLAHLSGDPTLVEAFERGDDIHDRTASELFETSPSDLTPAMRREAKVINYGIIYGMGPVRMSRELGISRAKAGEYIERYFETYAGVQEFYAAMLDAARRDGYVTTILGRRRYLPDIHGEHGGQRQLAERVATNTPIQGSAADIIKLAMVRLERDLTEAGLEARMVLQIHDELLLECPKRELDQVVSITKAAMEGAYELAVPVVVDVGSGPNWAEAH